MAFTSATWFWIASALSLFTWALHTFATNKTIVQPLLKAELNRVSKYTNFYCWHMVTIVLLAMAIGYAIAARYESAWELAAAATVLACLFAFWSIALIIWKKQKAFELPQWVLFLPIALAGFIGLI